MRLRAMAVLDPIKLVIENYPEDKTEELTVKKPTQVMIVRARV